MENHSQLLLKMQRNKYHQQIRSHKKNQQLWNKRKQYYETYNIPTTNSSNITQLISQIQVQLNNPFQSTLLKPFHQNTINTHNTQSDISRLIWTLCKYISQDLVIKGEMFELIMNIRQSGIIQIDLDCFQAYQALLINILYYSTEILEYNQLAIIDQINVMLKHHEMQPRENTIQMLNNIVYDQQKNWVPILRQYMVIYHLGDIVITYPYTKSYLNRALDFIEQFVNRISQNQAADSWTTLDALESKSIANMIESFLNTAVDDLPIQKRAFKVLESSTFRMNQFYVDNNRTLWEDVIDSDITNTNIKKEQLEELLQDGLGCIVNVCSGDQNDSDILLLMEYGLNSRIARELETIDIDSSIIDSTSFEYQRIQIVFDIIINILCSYDQKLSDFVLNTSVFNVFEWLLKNSEKVSSQMRCNLAKFVSVVLETDDDKILDILICINPLSVLISFLDSSQSELINCSVHAIWRLLVSIQDQQQTISIDFKVQLKEARPKFETIYYQDNLLEDAQTDQLQEILSIIQ